MNPKVAFVAARSAEAREAAKRLRQRYADVAPAKADIVVALGGDGFMLQMLHRFMGRDVPIYGMNRGTVGFLMNSWRENGLLQRLERAQRVVLNPLLMDARTAGGETVRAHAINEVSLLRQTRQTAKIAISIDGQKRLEELACDGVMVATPAGSTAYNLSVHGPILPLGAGLLALTPISPFRPRRWRGALLPDKAKVTIEVLEAQKRPVAAVADHDEVRSVHSVDIRMDHDISINMLFDPGHNLDERILREQFGF